MESFKLCLLFLACYVLSSGVDALPEGPPSAACTLLAPIHDTISPQTGAPPVLFEPEISVYEQGNTVECEYKLVTKLLI